MKRKRRTVASWKPYLLKEIPDSERRSLSASAAAQNLSVTDIVRRILCARYRLDCPPESYGYDAERDKQATTVLLRLQPKLTGALERESKRTGKTRRSIILLAIQTHYEREAA